MLTIVEKVIILQDVDIFKHIFTEDLAYIATIAEETRFKPDQAIYREGEVSDSMYLVLDGRVRLHRDDVEVMVAVHKSTFGVWSLMDDELRVTSATTLEECALLRIDREDFIDLLADNVRITQGILKAIVIRLRSLMGRVGKRS
ncbi:MAG: cyclic nucleotide-binding domain-containing protein [Candidatus Electryoneaceae bacterium]|nr:cyclic nucleotide-binding domain-containing protein [Candidatus Electryoneaceae bacterium]